MIIISAFEVKNTESILEKPEQKKRNLDRIKIKNMKNIIYSLDLNELVQPKEKKLIEEGQYYPKNISTIAMISRLKLSATQIAVYDMLCCLYNEKKGYAHPSYDYMAKKLGIEPKTVKIAVKKLEALKLVNKEVRKTRNNQNSTNLYKPYCIRISSKYYCEITKSENDTIPEGGLNEHQDNNRMCLNDHPELGSIEHNHGVETDTQIEDIRKKDNKFTNLNSQQFHNQVANLNPPFSFGVDPLPINLRKQFNIGQPINQNINSILISGSSNFTESHIETVNLDDRSLEEIYPQESIVENRKKNKKDPVYFYAPGYVQHIYNMVKKINEEFGHTTYSWKMSEMDLNNIIAVCKEETVEGFIKSINRQISGIVNHPNRPLGLSYFTKRYKDDIIEPNSGRLV
ncbi:MAG: helix-turn-helix domain-containing protein [Prolixibacteraceae bacterium]|nr:helix-turn-helix domain-containing protein [Prolixibacteraceae bacterium]